jgi:hypothetical protein
VVGRLCDGELDGGGRLALHGLLLEQKADLGIVLTFEHASTDTPCQATDMRRGCDLF